MPDAPRARALAIDALTQPVNVLVPVGVLAAAALVGALWLAPVAFGCWLVLAALTYFDEDKSQRLRSRPLSAAIASRVRAGEAARAAIRAAIAESRSPLEDVSAEVDTLVEAMHAQAGRAQRIHEFLAEESTASADPASLARLRARLDGLLAEIDAVVGALRTVQAEILAADGIEEHVLASQVIDLRTRVQTMSEGLEEAFADTRAQV
jgi:hypothetical protein